MRRAPQPAATTRCDDLMFHLTAPERAKISIESLFGSNNIVSDS